MRNSTLFDRFPRAFHDHPSLSKLVVLFTVSGGGLVAYAEANSGAQAIVPVEAESKKKRVVVHGSGWAGTTFLRNIKNSSYDIQVKRVSVFGNGDEEERCG